MSFVGVWWWRFVDELELIPFAFVDLFAYLVGVSGARRLGVASFICLFCCLRMVAHD